MKTRLSPLALFIYILLAACSQPTVSEEAILDLILSEEHHFAEILKNTSYTMNTDKGPLIDFESVTENKDDELHTYKQQFEITFQTETGEQKEVHGKIISETLFKSYRINEDNYSVPAHWKITAYGDATKVYLNAEPKYQLKFFPNGYVEIDQYIQLDLHQKLEPDTRENGAKNTDISKKLPQEMGARCVDYLGYRFISTKYEMTSSSTKSEVCESLSKTLQKIFGTQEKIIAVFQESFE